MLASTSTSVNNPDSCEQKPSFMGWMLQSRIRVPECFSAGVRVQIPGSVCIQAFSVLPSHVSSGEPDHPDSFRTSGLGAAKRSWSQRGLPAPPSGASHPAGPALIQNPGGTSANS